MPASLNQASSESKPLPAAEGFFVALVGSPNSGKTTLFNWLTGSKFRTVNYPGATVDYSLGRTHARYGAELVTELATGLAVMDTPGTYSLQPKSPDERVAFDAIFRHPKLGAARVVISVVDALQLSRHLLLTQQLIAGGFPVVVALTMSDLLREQGEQVDLPVLSQRLGCPVVEIDGRLGGGVDRLVEVTRTLCASNESHAARPHPERLSSWTDRETERALRASSLVARTVITRRLAPGPTRDSRVRTAKIDRVLLHPAFGLIAFFLIMGTLFSSIFWMATPLMEAIDWVFSTLGASIQALAPDSLLTNFLASGVVASAGAVIMFVPQIFVLFLGISLLEDSGYLARSAALVDRPFSAIGLNGRSFVPLLSGYACAVPAMMAVWKTGPFFRTNSSPCTDAATARGSCTKAWALADRKVMSLSVTSTIVGRLRSSR